MGIIFVHCLHILYHWRALMHTVRLCVVRSTSFRWCVECPCICMAAASLCPVLDQLNERTTYVSAIFSFPFSSFLPRRSLACISIFHNDFMKESTHTHTHVKIQSFHRRYLVRGCSHFSNSSMVLFRSVRDSQRPEYGLHWILHRGRRSHQPKVPSRPVSRCPACMHFIVVSTAHGIRIINLRSFVFIYVCFCLFFRLRRSAFFHPLSLFWTNRRVCVCVRVAVRTAANEEN